MSPLFDAKNGKIQVFSVLTINRNLYCKKDFVNLQKF